MQKPIPCQLVAQVLDKTVVRFQSVESPEGQLGAAVGAEGFLVYECDPNRTNTG